MVVKSTGPPRRRAARAAALAAALLALACHRAPIQPARTAAAPAQTAGLDDVRRIASILDYVASDYAGAVADGHVLKAAEYDEQLAFVADAAQLAQTLPPPSAPASSDEAEPLDAAAAVRRVAARVQAKAAPTEVASACRALRRRLLSVYGVVLAPTAPPARERGAALFAQACTPCHGAA